MNIATFFHRVIQACIRFLGCLFYLFHLQFRGGAKPMKGAVQVAFLTTKKTPHSKLFELQTERGANGKVGEAVNLIRENSSFLFMPFFCDFKMTFSVFWYLFFSTPVSNDACANVLPFNTNPNPEHCILFYTKVNLEETSDTKSPFLRLNARTKLKGLREEDGTQDANFVFSNSISHNRLWSSHWTLVQIVLFVKLDMNERVGKKIQFGFNISVVGLTRHSI